MGITTVSKDFGSWADLVTFALRTEQVAFANVFDNVDVPKDLLEERRRPFHAYWSGVPAVHSVAATMHCKAVATRLGFLPPAEPLVAPLDVDAIMAKPLPPIPQEPASDDPAAEQQGKGKQKTIRCPVCWSSEATMDPYSDENHRATCDKNARIYYYRYLAKVDPNSETRLRAIVGRLHSKWMESRQDD